MHLLHPTTTKTSSFVTILLANTRTLLHRQSLPWSQSRYPNPENPKTLSFDHDIMQCNRGDKSKALEIFISSQP